MPIFKIHHQTRFASIPNATLRDKRLSIESRGVLAYLLTHDDKFELSFVFLQKELGIGRDKLKNIVRELKQSGYLCLVAAHNKKGSFDGQEWFVFAESQNADFTVQTFNRLTEKPSDVKTVRRENRLTENPSDNKEENSSQKKILEEKEKDLYTAHETFSDESQITNEDHAAKIDETFIWLRQKKNLSRLPQSEWLALFTDLEAESITLDGFKEFYVWAESESWIVEKKVTLSPNVLRRMVEKYKNREHLEAKRKIQESKNGNISNGHNSKTSTAKQIESGERLNALIEDAKRFQPPTIR